MKKISILTLLSLFNFGCDYGLTLVNCPESQNKPSERAALIVSQEWPHIVDSVNTMNIVCKERDQMQFDVDAYTVRLVAFGSSPRGLMVVDNKIPVGNAICHEAAHWSLMVEGEDPCSSHSTDCGWDQLVVDRLTNVIQAEFE